MDPHKRKRKAGNVSRSIYTSHQGNPRGNSEVGGKNVGSTKSQFFGGLGFRVQGLGFIYVGKVFRLVSGDYRA